jgi:hypothetical protein
MDDRPSGTDAAGNPLPSELLRIQRENYDRHRLSETLYRQAYRHRLSETLYRQAYWKHAFLAMKADIDNFLRRVPPESGAVCSLIEHHCRRLQELLIAEVNGGLDELYEDELRAVREAETKRKGK